MRGMLTFLVLLPAYLALVSGCTVQRVESDTTQALEWLRLKHGSEAHRSGRWQLPWNASIVVQELSPAADPTWLPAAQQGVSAVFPAPAGPAGPSYRLLVAWPAPEGETTSAHVSMWDIVDMDQYLPDFQGRFDLQVALVRASDGQVVDAARLDVTPRWLSGRSAGPKVVRNAFRDFADTFRPAY